MKPTHIEKLLLAYLKDDFPPDNKQKIKEQLYKAGYNKEYLKKIKKLYVDLDHISVPEPREQMTTRFYQWMNSLSETAETEKSLFTHKKTKLAGFHGPGLRQRILMPAAAVLLVSLAGYGLLRSARYADRIESLTQEIHQIKEMMILNMLDRPSPIERIKAVHLIKNSQNIHPAVIAAIVKTLNSDPNTNVRLVAVETLAQFAEDPDVRQGLIASIPQQNSPLVQLSLADIMVSLQEPRAADQFRKLLKKKDLNYAVRDRLQDLIQLL